MPVMILTAVDFPAPFSPISATTRPAGSWRSAPSSARTPSKWSLIPSRARTGGSAIGLEELCELLDVALVEHEGLGHGGFPIGIDLQRAHAADRHLGSRLAVGLLGQERVCSI